MTKIYTLPQRDRQYDEASQWIAKLDKGLSDAEVAALEQWIAANDENATVLMAMARLWDRMDGLSRLSALFPVPARRRRNLAPYRLGIAASLFIAVLAGIWTAFELGGRDLSWIDDSRVALSADRTYETAVGEQSTVMLPDGTQVVLNTSSLLHVDYTPEYRLLTLERGEINVRVAKDVNRPLSVIARGKVVQAIGTEFNIEIRDDQKIELVVTEGKVRVGVHQPAPDRGQRTVPEVLSQSSTTVSAGEELILGDPEEEIAQISPEEIEVKLSWRNGNLIFKGESLEEAVKEIGRYTSVEFVFLDDDLRKVRVAGLFKAGDVDGLLAALRENFDVSYQRVDDQTVLLDKK